MQKFSSTVTRIPETPFFTSFLIPWKGVPHHPWNRRRYFEESSQAARPSFLLRERRNNLAFQICRASGMYTRSGPVARSVNLLAAEAFFRVIFQVKVHSWENQTVESFTITEKNSCLAVTPDFRSKQRIVVRVCRDKELCRDGNCVKKCSKKPKSTCQEILISNFTFYDKISNITGTPRNVTGLCIR